MEYIPNIDEVHYIESAGYSNRSILQIKELLLERGGVKKIIIITHDNGNYREHALAISYGQNPLVVATPEFASGYIGVGPQVFSRLVSLISSHCNNIEEIEVEFEMYIRLAYQRFSSADLKEVWNAVPIKPSRVKDYILDKTALNKAFYWDVGG